MAFYYPYKKEDLIDAFQVDNTSLWNKRLKAIVKYGATIYAPADMLAKKTKFNSEGYQLDKETWMFQHIDEPTLYSHFGGVAFSDKLDDGEGIRAGEPIGKLIDNDNNLYWGQSQQYNYFIIPNDLQNWIKTHNLQYVPEEKKNEIPKQETVQLPKETPKKKTIGLGTILVIGIGAYYLLGKK